MIKETFLALKEIGISDEKVLDVVVALETEHREHRQRLEALRAENQQAWHAIHRDLHLLKWMVGVLYLFFIPLVLRALGGR